jgi:glucose-1-phosphate cytidylyltransferase
MQSRDLPKAMMPLGHDPILWHVIGWYARHGVQQFFIAAGWAGYRLTEFFASRAAEELPVRQSKDHELARRFRIDDLEVTVVDTGVDVNTGGRLRALSPYLPATSFFLTWCDGLADVNLYRLAAFHRAHGRPVTVTAVHPPARFGRLELDGHAVRSFREKDPEAEGWINGAYFMISPEVLSLIDSAETSFERDVLPPLAARGDLQAYRHTGFWQCMDTPDEHLRLQELWKRNEAPWAH